MSDIVLPGLIIHTQNRRIAFIVISLIFSDCLFAEPLVQQQHFLIENSPFQSNIHLGGMLDGANTYSHSYSIDVEQSFEPMRSIILKNNGDTVIRAPRLIINNEHGIHDFDSMIDRIFIDTNTPKEKALALWLYFRDHRVHFRSPESGCNITDPIKLLGIYGYITCGSASKLLAGVGKKLGYPVNVINMSSFGAQHSVPLIDFGGGYVILDMDAQVFYLDYDNETLVGKKKVHEDNFLIRRTHHFGKNRKNDFDVAPLYNNHFAETSPSTCMNHSLDFDLRPGESFTYDWSQPHALHHRIPVAPNPIPWMVSNSRFVYQPEFTPSFLNNYVYDSSNLIFDQDGSLHQADANEAAELVILMSSPYAIVDGEVNLYIRSATEMDSVFCDYSPNNSIWNNVWSLPGNGLEDASIPLYRQIDPMLASELHYFFIRIRMKSNKNPKDCRLDSLRITAVCQLSKYNMPQLQLGENTIDYSDESRFRNLDVVFEYQESLDNIPPLKIDAPIYPVHGGVTKGGQFTFRWPNGVDGDGDEIVDYDFQLSDCSDMRFPLSPTFDRYLSTLHDPLIAEFAVPFSGLLNDGTEYFWRVRSRDSRGAWGEWSDVWSFTPSTVMMPEQPVITENSSGRMLAWWINPNGKTPAYFQIHGSHIPYGFSPDEETLIDETSDHTYNLAGLHFPYYRVIACDENGRPSGPSRVAVSGETGIPEEPLLPASFVLKQNSPNPFNATTRIEYSIFVSAHVKLIIYNALGRHVETLVDQFQPAGVYVVMWGSNALPSGTYYYTLESGGTRLAKSMTVVR